MQQLLQLVEQHKAGKPVGIFSVCSAHPWVLKAALRQAKTRGTPVLVEATSNQVNQFGGYTGQTAEQFRDALWQLADEEGLARDRLWLGGDHLGPNAWQVRLPSSNCASTVSTNCFWASTVSIWLPVSPRLTLERHTSTA